MQNVKKDNKPYSTAEFFHEISSILISNSEVPDILDYSLATSHELTIKDCEFDIKMDVHFGGNEGIYLYLYLEGSFGHEVSDKRCELGTFKTLHETKEAFQQMALLGANFICAARDFVEKDLDAFIWSGYKLTAVAPDGKRLSGYYISDKERALERKKDFIKTYPDSKVVLMDMEKRTEL